MKIVARFLIVVSLTSPLAAIAGTDAPVERGARVYQVCLGCHGPNGVSLNPQWPNLAGQKKDYLVKQLEDFAADRRNDPLMSPMAKTLSKDAVADVAAYLSSL